MKLLVLISTIFSVTTFAQVGLEGGNTRNVYSIEGDLFVSCYPAGEPPMHARYQCVDDILEPSSYDYFRGPAGISADSVSLTSLRADGSSITKKLGYNSEKSRSENSINLWILTLFQRPLLKDGQNNITYTLSLNGSEVGRGDFQVLVQRSKGKVCPSGSMTSFDDLDCRSGHTACGRYFRYYNYCQ